MADPYWSDVVLALPMDGAEGSTAIVDLKAKTVTAVGNTKLTYAQSKFGKTAAYFDGDGDKLTLASSTDWQLVELFTVEFWFFVVAWQANSPLLRVNATGGLQIGRQDSTTKLGVAAANVAWLAQSAALPTTGVWHFGSISRDADNNLTFYVDGTPICSVFSSYAFAPGLLEIGGEISGAYFNGYIFDGRITKGVARNPVPPTVSYFDPDVRTPVSAAMIGEYGDVPITAAGLVGQYSLIMEQAIVGRYGDSANITSGLIGRYGNAATVQAALVGRYNDMVPVLAALEGRYHLMHSVLSGLEGQYAICGSSVLAALDGRYDLRERNEIMAALVGYYSLLPGATIQQIVCPVRIGGVSVRWSSVSWTRSEDNYLIEATIVLRDPAEFGSIAKLDTVEIDWAGTTYTLFVSAKLRARSVSGDPGAAEYGADYTIIARSLTAGLDAPHALPVTMSWSATTLASVIAADLIASLPELITLDFRLEDWPQPGGTFFLTAESPLEGLRKLAAIIGGIVQTSPDNALILRMADPTPPAEYAKVVPAWIIEDSGLFSDSESEAESNRYNVITVSNQGESDRSTRFEVEDITEYRKRVRGYRVPWADFGLATSGGSWVTIEDGGVVEDPVVDELVEFVDGSSSAAKPVYSMVSGVWLQASLGAITAAEDGSLTSEVVGNSMAKISYTTRCHVWIGTSDRSEEVQFYEVEK